MSESGIVLVNKPAGVSSNKVVNIVKHHLGAKKCGHLGTLDVEGEGLLPVTVNSATKLFDFFLNKDKTYETVFIFGFETDTLDLAGKVVKEKECDISLKEVERVCKQMLGKQMQMPPQYSAKKVNGKVAYKEARQGRELELHPKEIELYDIRVLEQLQKNKFKFSISCSSGTYIRCVCRDMAEKLSTYGSMQCILRTRCGGFMLKDAYTLQEIEKGNFSLISCEEVFDYPSLKLDKIQTEKILNGQFLACEEKDGKYKVYGNFLFLGIGEVNAKVLRLTLRLV